MAKYDGQIIELKNLLPVAKNILIAVPVGADIDKLAVALSLFLALQAQSKQVNVVCDDTILVAQSHLFGIDHVQKTIPQTNGGNFMITLGGVAVADPSVSNGWKVPALQNLDWYGEAGNLNLVFHVVPGQTFQPSSVTPHSQGSGFNLIFTIGSPDLNSLGAVYSSNQPAFSGVHTVNIDNHAANTGFGQTNVVDQVASSVSEIMADLIPALGLPFDADTASNLLAGIFDATSNLTSSNVGADTYSTVANCLRAGGKRSSETQLQPTQPGLDLSALMPKQSGPVDSGFITPPVVPASQAWPGSVNAQSLAPETPRGEATTPGMEIEAEPDWLTPKVFKGSVG